jgi:hypothetical protein
MSVELNQQLADGLPFEPKQQDALFGFMLLDKNFLLQVKDRIKPNWFVDGYTGKAYDSYVKFFDTFGHEPKSDDELFLFEDVFILPQPEKNKIRACMLRARGETSNYSLDVLKTGLTGWLQSRVYHQYVSQSATLFNNRKFGEAKNVLASAVRELQDISFEGKPPADFSNPRALVQQITEATKDALTFGHPLVDRLLNPDCVRGSLLNGDSTVLLSPTNIGKCSAAGTEVILYDGTITTVERVRVGDRLMGPDGQPRNVLSVTSGIGPMYRVTPKSGGRSFVVNDVHVLSLRELWTEDAGKRGAGAVVNIPLNEYQSKTKNWKRRHGLWRASLDFSETELSVPPYILGLWLGDRHTRTAALTNTDSPLIDAWSEWLRSNGDTVRASDISYFASRGDASHRLGSASFKKLKSIGVIGNKRVPHAYLTSSRQQRLALLAGLVDSDGFYSGDRNPNIEITQKNEKLARDIAFLARSLGFKVSETKVKKADQNGTEGEYWRLTILGKLSTIPVLLSRKRAIDGKKDPATTGFSIEYVGVDTYYGFTLDADHLYLHSDFTVTHNTTTKISIAVANLLQGKSVIFISHEGRKTDIQEKIWQSILKVTKQQFRSLSLSNDPGTEQQMRAVASLLTQNLVYIDYQKPGTTVEEVVSMVRQHQQRRKAKYGKGFDLFCNDYPAILGAGGMQNLRSERRHKDAYVYRYLVDYSGEQEMHGLFSVQTNREGSKKNKKTGEYQNKNQLVQLEDVQEAYEITNSATNLITVNRSPEDQAMDIITFLIAKSRSSETNIAVSCRSIFSCARSHDAELPAVWYRYGGEGLDSVASLMQEYNNREVPFNYKELRHGTTKS